jgi:hypothetical protein
MQTVKIQRKVGAPKFHRSSLTANYEQNEKYVAVATRNGHVVSPRAGFSAINSEPDLFSDFSLFLALFASG